MLELDSVVAMILETSTETQGLCASWMVANSFFFSAMKATSGTPSGLIKVLEDIKLQVLMQWMFLSLCTNAKQLDR